MTRSGENQPLLGEVRARSAQGQNNDVEARNMEENQRIQESQESQEVRIRF